MVHEEPRQLQLRRNCNSPPGRGVPSPDRYVLVLYVPTPRTGPDTHAHGACILTAGSVGGQAHCDRRARQAQGADPARAPGHRPLQILPFIDMPDVPCRLLPASRLPRAHRSSVPPPARPDPHPHPHPHSHSHSSSSSRPRPQIPISHPARPRASWFRAPAGTRGSRSPLRIIAYHIVHPILSRSVGRLDDREAWSAAPPAVNPSARTRALSLAAYPANPPPRPREAVQSGSARPPFHGLR